MVFVSHSRVRPKSDRTDGSNVSLVSAMSNLQTHGPSDEDSDHSQADLDNHANQLNPNNDEYWGSRGEDGRPDDWEDRED